MKRLGLAVLIAAWGGSGCVDPSSLTGFECDDAGRCKAPNGTTGGGTSSTGGGGTVTGGGSGGGSVTGGGNGGGATGGGGAVVCNTSTCTGCCDDNGVCRGGDELTACGQGGMTCAACASGTRCQAAVCQPLNANGGMCVVGAECASGFCAAGVCCTSACTGTCESCNGTGTEGRCSPLAEATAPAACGDYACDGVSGSCPSTCTTSRQCASGRFCNNGVCAPLKLAGVSCGSSAECQTGFCADGVCCDQACSGSCDRCNLAGSVGTCGPAPAADPGSPACGGSVVCNGTLVDCPILCTTGCPMGTFCSGTYCSAKRTNGVTCAAAPECQSNFCVDGVCCNVACGDLCDACSVAQGAAVNGTCGLLGPSRICRSATNTCDQEERCNGAAATCPSNGFTDAGVGCGTTTFTAWSTCDGGAACASSGTQSRTRSDKLCTGAGACGNVDTGENQACVRVTEGISCGTTTFSAYTACTYAATCSTAGSRTRVRTDPLCASGTCSAVQVTETDTAGCTRSTANVSCGASTFGPYGTCAFASTCAESGSRTRTRTDPVCQTGACGATTATETDSAGCPRTTGGTSCGTTMTGAYGACSYAATCSTTGTRSRTVSTYTCGSGACNTSTVTENDTSGCGRTTTGSSCGTTLTGAYTACSYANACSNTGSRTRTVTTYGCDAAGACAPNTVTETDTAGCARNQDGTSCGTTVTGAYGSCSYPQICANGGSRTRTVTDYTCGASACNTKSVTETDTTACTRNTNGNNCGAFSCGTCSAGCNCSCERTQSCTGPRCNALQACVSQSWQQACGTCSGCMTCAKPEEKEASY